MVLTISIVTASMLFVIKMLSTNVIDDISTTRRPSFIENKYSVQEKLMFSCLYIAMSGLKIRQLLIKITKKNHLNLKDNIVTSECKKNDTECIQYTTICSNEGLLRWGVVGYVTGPTLGDRNSPNHSTIHNCRDSTKQ